MRLGESQGQRGSTHDVGGSRQAISGRGFGLSFVYTRLSLGLLPPWGTAPDRSWQVHEATEPFPYFLLEKRVNLATASADEFFAHDAATVADAPPSFSAAPGVSS